MIMFRQFARNFVKFKLHEKWIYSKEENLKYFFSHFSILSQLEISKGNMNRFLNLLLNSWLSYFTLFYWDRSVTRAEVLFFNFLKNSDSLATVNRKEVFQKMTDEEMEVEQTPPENMETEEAAEAPEEVIEVFIVKLLCFSLVFGLFLGSAKSIGRSPWRRRWNSHRWDLHPTSTSTSIDLWKWPA